MIKRLAIIFDKLFDEKWLNFWILNVILDEEGWNRWKEVFHCETFLSEHSPIQDETLKPEESFKQKIIQKKQTVFTLQIIRL